MCQSLGSQYLSTLGKTMHLNSGKLFFKRKHFWMVVAPQRMLGPSASNLTHFRNFGELIKHNFWGEECGEDARGG